MNYSIILTTNLESTKYLYNVLLLQQDPSDSCTRIGDALNYLYRYMQPRLDMVRLHMDLERKFQTFNIFCIPNIIVIFPQSITKF